MKELRRQQQKKYDYTSQRNLSQHGNRLDDSSKIDLENKEAVMS
jgi:hypothetical protein